MPDVQLIYFADPMCSWCWGFAPVIGAVRQAWGEDLPIRLVMGGLRPGTTEPMSDAARETLRGHWQAVTQASGQPFGAAALGRSGFVYDTDPAARAVVAMRRLAPAAAIGFLERTQEAFYVDGADVTDPRTLSSLAAEFGVDVAAFAAALQDDAVRQETWRDYAISRNAGVTGFPTLILGPRPDGAYLPISRGFSPAPTVLATIAQAMEMLVAAPA
jgi:putative protein-disulfide isomerase